MELNPDGGVTIANITLTAEQVAAIKAAKPVTRKTGWWIMDAKTGKLHYFIGNELRGSYGNVKDSGFSVTGYCCVILWTTGVLGEYGERKWLY